MQVNLQYGDGDVAVEIPDDSVVIREGIVHEPTPLADPDRATREAIARPLGMPPIGDLVGPGGTVTISFPDRVKGGSHVTAHRRLAITAVLDELAAAGVRDRDITLVCAIGLHRKNRPEEWAEYLGADLLERCAGMRVVNHDAEDPEGMIDLGESSLGDPVQVNRAAVEADLSVLVGHASGNPYGGYSGGWKMPATGLTSWRSIAAHHAPRTMYRPDFVPATPHGRFREQLRAIGERMEEHLGGRFLAVDAVLDSRSRQLAVAAGAISEVERASWPLAAQRTDVELDGDPFDVLLLGMPRTFHYGPGMGSNPILMMQACGAAIVRAKAALVRAPIVIAASICDGWFNDADFPSYRPAFDLLQAVDHPRDMVQFHDQLSTDEGLVSRYREDYGYHPFHAFSMVYMGGVALDQTQAVVIAGAERPDLARAMGARTAPDVESALGHAAALLGRTPRVLCVPQLTAPAFHPRMAG
ncbi:lactate racemase domain-containing protein [Aestuariimicrobium kwangyangense]|uniref:lactate racemase domain-containing protein n=1 Tax=Aestuariimicrobium kwangyangense TaxID=396389 RepID=UPI0003B41509|nr:lactate racemase domain-containing protein [Aestuariimicrobium kwangyangense]